LCFGWDHFVFLVFQPVELYLFKLQSNFRLLVKFA
jgi:hypothetical protein